MNAMHRQRGFSLVELVMVIVIGGVIAATLTVFLRPAMDNYLATRARADLTDQADTALRRMVRDVRLAVPNSIRTPGTQCFETVPTSAGGRFRSGPDTLNDSAPGCTPGIKYFVDFDFVRIGIRVLHNCSWPEFTRELAGRMVGGRL